MPLQELIRAEELAAVLKPSFLEELCDNADLEYSDNTSDIQLARMLVKDGFLLSDLKLKDLKNLITDYYGEKLEGARTIYDCVDRVLEIRSQKGSRSQKRKAESDDVEIVCDAKTKRCYKVKKEVPTQGPKKAIVKKQKMNKFKKFEDAMDEFSKSALKRALVEKWEMVIKKNDDVYDLFREMYDNGVFTIPEFKKTMKNFQ
jgi:hypothetical protein